MGYCCDDVVCVDYCVSIYCCFVVSYCEVEEELIGYVEEIYYFGDVLFIMIEVSNLWG